MHRYPVPGQRLLGSLTGAVASTAIQIWGALTVTSEANLAVCWDLRLALCSGPISVRIQQVASAKYPALLVLTSEGSENATGADNQQGSLPLFGMTPQRLYAGHPAEG